MWIEFELNFFNFIQLWVNFIQNVRHFFMSLGPFWKMCVHLLHRSNKRCLDLSRTWSLHNHSSAGERLRIYLVGYLKVTWWRALPATFDVLLAHQWHQALMNRLRWGCLVGDGSIQGEWMACRGMSGIEEVAREVLKVAKRARSTWTKSSMVTF